MTVQTVLRDLEAARLRRGACHDGLSFSLERADSDAGRMTDAREAAHLAEIGAVPSVGQPGRRRHRTPQSVNGFCKAELVVGPGRWGGRDVSHQEAVTVSSFTWWWRPGFTALSETGAHDFERADAAEDHTTSEGGSHGPESPGMPG